MSLGHIGFTDDGFVFMTILSTLDGKPTQTTLQWRPDQAQEICQKILDAAEKAMEKLQ